MKITQHVIISAAAGAGVYAATRSWEITAGTFIMGVFIDLDHIIDYWREHPFRMDLVHFFATCEEYRLNRAMLFLHSLELAVPLALLAYFVRSPWITGFLIGWSVHMIFDYLGNKTNNMTYFFIFRWSVGFDMHRVFETRQKCGGNG